MQYVNLITEAEPNHFKTTTSRSMGHNITVGKDPISRGENQ